MGVIAAHQEQQRQALDKWRRRMLDLAEFIAGWSKDPSTKVGCVITDGNRVVSLGFNGPPSGFDDSYWQDERARKLGVSLHAEENALLHANRSLDGCEVFITHMPCSRCFTKLTQVGVDAIYYLADPDIEERWSTARETIVDIISREVEIPHIVRVC